MVINLTEIIGLIAASLTTAAFVPQVYKTWKSREAQSLSLVMYIVFFIGVMMWLAYGILMNSISIILANIVTGVLALALVVMIIVFRNK